MQFIANVNSGLVVLLSFCYQLMMHECGNHFYRHLGNFSRLSVPGIITNYNMFHMAFHCQDMLSQLVCSLGG